MRERILRLGIDFHAAVKDAGISRPTGYTLLRGTASVGTLRRLEDWVVRQESKRGGAQPRDGSAVQLDEWTQLGRELAELDPDDFDRTIDGLRDLIAAKKLQATAIRKMFRATPER